MISRTRAEGDGWGSRFVLGAMFSAALIAVGLGALIRHVGVARPAVGMGPVFRIEEIRQGPLFAHPSTETERVLFLGDSTAILRRAGRMIPGQLQWLLNLDPSEADVRVISVVFPGLDSFAYFALADEIVSLQPRLVILALNLRTLRPRNEARPGRPELAGWIAPGRIFEALRLPPYALGLSADQLLLYIGLVRARLDGVWQWVRSEQAQLGLVWSGFDKHLGEGGTAMLRDEIGRRFIEPHAPADARRHSEDGVRHSYGEVLAGLRPGHPTVEALAAAVGRLSAAGIESIVYVVPVNVGHFSKLGIVRGAAWESSLAVISQAIRARGGTLIELDDLLTDDAFKDQLHFGPIGHAAVGKSLAATARRLLSDARVDD